MASQVKTNKVSPASGTTVTLGNSGDTISVASGATASGFLPSSISTSGDDFQFNSGYGSVATAYGCRAWVNFVGTGTVSINDSGNVSSITDLGAGYYQVNFSTALVDANYSAIAVPAPNGDSTNPRRCNVFGDDASNPAYTAPTVNNFTIITAINAGLSDASIMCVSVFR